MRKEMNSRLRYLLAWIAGISITIFAWYLIATTHPTFTKLSIIGLVPSVAASILGGFVVACLSPKYKVKMALSVGFVVALPMLVFLLHSGFSHYGRNPFFWYWPVYVIPFFVVGGILGRGTCRHA